MASIIHGAGPQRLEPGPEAVRPRRASGPDPLQQVLGLQRLAGNAAVSRLVAERSACGCGCGGVGSCGPLRADEEAAQPKTSTIDTGVDEGDSSGGATTKTVLTGPGSGTLPPAGPATCTTVGTMAVPSGNLVPTMSGNRLSSSWNMSADFTPTPPTRACRQCGEYRQYVKGKFTLDGTKVAHDLAGTPLSETSFNEDLARFGGRAVGYGRHSDPFPNSNFTRPDQDSGTRWDGYDAPGISTASSGRRLGIDLQFRGELVDACTGATLATRHWSVRGTGVTP